jgi:hypothetical protein
MTAEVPVKVVLDWLKEKFDMDLDDLPVGDPGASASCPVALALGKYAESAIVDFDHVIVDWGPDLHGRPRVREYDLPYEVSQWIQGFDSGMYPKYIAPEVAAEKEGDTP